MLAFEIISRVTSSNYSSVQESFYRNLESGLWVLQWGGEGRIKEQVPRNRETARRLGQGLEQLGVFLGGWL